MISVAEPNSVGNCHEVALFSVAFLLFVFFKIISPGSCNARSFPACCTPVISSATKRIEYGAIRFLHHILLAALTTYNTINRKQQKKHGGMMNQCAESSCV